MNFETAVLVMVPAAIGAVLGWAVGFLNGVRSCDRSHAAANELLRRANDTRS